MGGRVREFQEAIQRLIVIVPLSMLLIGILLYTNFGSLTDTLLAASVIPMALIGGVFALAVTGTPFSVSAAIGFVALFGIAAMDGIIVLSFFNRMMEEGMDRAGAILRTCQTQMRPVMMTCVAACVGRCCPQLSPMGSVRKCRSRWRWWSWAACCWRQPSSCWCCRC